MPLPVVPVASIVPALMTVPIQSMEIPLPMLEMVAPLLFSIVPSPFMRTPLLACSIPSS
ncbi:hypothetical protein D9M68_918750 [compost metagenome]